MAWGTEWDNGLTYRMRWMFGVQMRHSLKVDNETMNSHAEWIT